jgi:hypothetical protein
MQHLSMKSSPSSLYLILPGIKYYSLHLAPKGIELRRPSSPVLLDSFSGGPHQHAQHCPTPQAIANINNTNFVYS